MVVVGPDGGSSNLQEGLSRPMVDNPGLKTVAC